MLFSVANTLQHQRWNNASDELCSHQPQHGDRRPYWLKVKQLVCYWGSFSNRATSRCESAYLITAAMDVLNPPTCHHRDMRYTSTHWTQHLKILKDVKAKENNADTRRTFISRNSLYRCPPALRPAYLLGNVDILLGYLGSYLGTRLFAWELNGTTTRKVQTKIHHHLKRAGNHLPLLKMQTTICFHWKVGDTCFPLRTFRIFVIRMESTQAAWDRVAFRILV